MEDQEEPNVHYTTQRHHPHDLHFGAKVSSQKVYHRLSPKDLEGEWKVVIQTWLEAPPNTSPAIAILAETVLEQPLYSFLRTVLGVGWQTYKAQRKGEGEEEEEEKNSEDRYHLSSTTAFRSLIMLYACA